MELWTLYVAAAGVGCLGCLSATSLRVNRLASLAHIGGILAVGIYAWRFFGLMHMLMSILTVFIVGMILAYFVLKIREKRSKKYNSR